MQFAKQRKLGLIGYVVVFYIQHSEKGKTTGQETYYWLPGVGK